MDTLFGRNLASAVEDIPAVEDIRSLHEAVVDIRVPADIPVVAALEAAGFPSAQEGWIGLLGIAVGADTAGPQDTEMEPQMLGIAPELERRQMVADQHNLIES